MKDQLKKAFFAGVRYGAADGNAPTFKEWLKTLKPPADCDKHCPHNFSDYRKYEPRCIHCGEKNDYKK